MDSKKFAALLEDDDGLGRNSSSFDQLRSAYSSPRGSMSITSRRSSRTTSVGSLDVADGAVSCVTRDTAPEDCARHRFIVWAAVKRNSSSRIAPHQKLECPLAQCRRPFPNHELMLRHLASCDFLASGQYYCHEHGRTERFDDVKCKRCLGHPSKRRKMLSIAKNFFHSLGHNQKPRKGHPMDGTGDDVSSILPPSYASIAIDQTPSGVELPSTEIVEIDSTEVSAAQSAHSGTSSIDPQALYASELDSTGAPAAEALMPWGPSPMLQDAVLDAAYADMTSSHGAHKPSLQLTTHGLEKYRRAHRSAQKPAPRPPQSIPQSKGLSPSNSVRSTMSADSTTSNVSNGSSMVSPASAWSGAWSMSGGDGFNTSLTTPVDLISPADLMCGNDFLALPHGFGNDTYQLPQYSLNESLFELPADVPDLQVDPSFMANAATLTFPMESSSEITPGMADGAAAAGEPENQATAHGRNKDDATKTIKADDCRMDTKAMVESAWDALEAHVAASQSKTRHLDRNHLSTQLKRMPARTVIDTGLGVLKEFLQGKIPSSAMGIVCFVHLSYAFSLVVSAKQTQARAPDLYHQALNYAQHVAEWDCNAYTEIVDHIWKPFSDSELGMDAKYPTAKPPPDRTACGKGKQPAPSIATVLKTDALLLAVRSFLDDLEMTVVHGDTPVSMEVLCSELYARHRNGDSKGHKPDMPFSVTLKFIISMLLADIQDARNLHGRLRLVGERAEKGDITSVRVAELEMLKAGRDCFDERQYFEDFVPTITKMCDPLYKQHKNGVEGRDEFQLMGVDLFAATLDRVAPPPVPSRLKTPDLLESFLRDFEDAHSPTRSVVGPPFLGDGSSDQLLNEAMLIDSVVLDHDQPESFSHLAATAAALTAPPSFSMTSQPEAVPAVDASSADADANAYQEASQAKTAGHGDEAPYAKCELCGYRPKGDPQWFKGSMAKHKKMQHSTKPPVFFSCPYPGCTSVYKNRQDNLRQHQIEKGHFVDDVEGGSRRPSKRKKRAADDEQ